MLYFNFIVSSPPMLSRVTPTAIILATSVFALVDPRRPDIQKVFTDSIVGCNAHARRWIRAAFHGSGTFGLPDRNGGNTGAFLFEGDRFENRGLEETITFYKSIRDRFGVSFADALAFGGIMAVQECGGPVIAFKPGRIDTAKTAGPEGRLPNPHISATDILGSFVGRMGFLDDETVALIAGGHSVARISASKSESGQEGDGDETPTKFDNAIFGVLLASNVTGNIVRVPGDVSMAKDPRMRAIMERFAKDNGAFFAAFTRAYGKLMDLGATFESAPIKTTPITPTTTVVRVETTMPVIQPTPPTNLPNNPILPISPQPGNQVKSIGSLPTPTPTASRRSGINASTGNSVAISFMVSILINSFGAFFFS
jgi:hypothetical protein